MRKLSRSTLVKLLIPIGYLLLASTYFTYVLMYEDVYVHHWVGLVLALVAFILWVMSRVQLGNSFTLAPHAKFLVRSGIYSRLRHPVYYFSILAVVGISIFSWSLFMLIPLVILIVVESIRIKQEEKILLQKFGEEYIQYKKGTWF